MMAGFGLLWILILGGVVWGGAQLFGRSARPTTPAPPPAADNAEEILRQRYARGEIDRDEYESRLRDLRR